MGWSTAQGLGLTVHRPQLSFKGYTLAIPFGLGAAELTALVVGSTLAGQSNEWAAAYLVYRATGYAPLIVASGVIAYRRL